jgi:glutamate-1-semialdehyde 2,1-aminomutase
MTKYENSEEWLIRAEKTIPLGSQTFSKSRTQYPVGISPLYLEKGKGSTVWDLDGNRYIDLVNALASVTLGYSYRGMNVAIKKQLTKGISLSLPARLEAEVSERLVDLIPSAEMVRFGKNGSDATSAAIRLARAYTGKTMVLACGYHGWQDWYIGATTRNKGVPEVVANLTKIFPYNNLVVLENLLQEFSGQVAAIIMEPMNVEYPLPGYLESVQKLAKKHGVILIFDETITGFRFSNGGAQQIFEVTPDLSTFGKGMANGMPISAVVGRREIMLEMEEIFFSGTFGGELLSLSAAKFTIDEIVKLDATSVLTKNGNKISDELIKIIETNNLNEVLKISGHGSWKILSWKNSNEFTADEVRTYFMQEMFKRGILILASHNISLSHKTRDFKRILEGYEEVLGEISVNIKNGSLREKLLAKPNPSLFKIR